MRDIAAAQAKAAGRAGVEFIDMREATEGHWICDDDPWFAGSEPRRPGAPYHPYVQVHEVIAEMLEKLLAQRPDPAGPTENVS